MSKALDYESYSKIRWEFETTGRQICFGYGFYFGFIAGVVGS